MKFMDLMEHLFRRGDPAEVRVGQPLTLREAKATLSMIAVHQPLADMRKVADALKQLEDEYPQYVTFSMSHYYNEPKRVRFQSEGGTFLDADAIATAFAQSTILQDTITIQHLMGDIADNREHRDPDTTPAVPIDELVKITAERCGNETDIRRAWLFSLYDQLDDINEATKGNLTPLQQVLEHVCDMPVVNSSDAGTAKSALQRIIVRLLFPESSASDPDEIQESNESSAEETARNAMSNPEDATNDYLKAVQVFHDHGVSIPTSVILE